MEDAGVRPSVSGIGRDGATERRTKAAGQETGLPLARRQPNPSRCLVQSGPRGIDVALRRRARILDLFERRIAARIPEDAGRRIVAGVNRRLVAATDICGIGAGDAAGSGRQRQHTGNGAWHDRNLDRRGRTNDGANLRRDRSGRGAGHVDAATGRVAGGVGASLLI